MGEIFHPPPNQNDRYRRGKGSAPRPPPRLPPMLPPCPPLRSPPPEKLPPHRSNLPTQPHRPRPKRPSRPRRVTRPFRCRQTVVDATLKRIQNGNSRQKEWFTGACEMLRLGGLTGRHRRLPQISPGTWLGPRTLAMGGEVRPQSLRPGFMGRRFLNPQL